MINGQPTRNNHQSSICQRSCSLWCATNTYLVQVDCQSTDGQMEGHIGSGNHMTCRRVRGLHVRRSVLVPGLRQRVALAMAVTGVQGDFLASPPRSTSSGKEKGRRVATGVVLVPEFVSDVTVAQQLSREPLLLAHKRLCITFRDLSRPSQLQEGSSGGFLL